MKVVGVVRGKEDQVQIAGVEACKFKRAWVLISLNERIIRTRPDRITGTKLLVDQAPREGVPRRGSSNVCRCTGRNKTFYIGGLTAAIVPDRARIS